MSKVLYLAIIDLAEEQLGSSPGVLHALASKLRVTFRTHEENVPSAVD